MTMARVELQVNSNPSCQVPSGGVRLDANSKYFFFRQPLHWDECKKHCKKQGLELASIRNLEEQAFVEKFIDDYIQGGKYPGSNRSSQFGSFWFGANDHTTEGTFRWMTGEEIEFQKFWYHNPNNDKKATHGKYGEHCGELIYFPNSTESWWNDQFCGQSKPFFCEFSTNRLECFSSPVYEENVKFPELIGIGNTEFYNSGTLQLNWTEAYNFCEEQELSLVSAHDAEAVTSISNVVNYDIRPFTHYWTSGVFSAECCDKKKFQYQTLNWLSMEEQSGNLKKKSHIKWWKVEPSDEGGIREENCVEFLHIGKGNIEFSAVHCSLPLQFICIKRPGGVCRCPGFLY